MITKEQAVKLGDGSLREEIHCEVVRDCKRTEGPRGGITDKVVVVRSNGRCQTWKRDQAMSEQIGSANWSDWQRVNSWIKNTANKIERQNNETR
jgi:hypothetical protein